LRRARRTGSDDCGEEAERTEHVVVAGEWDATFVS
jgi:hypothetical protein